MPPRRRKDPADSWLPPRVYRGKSAYEWRPAGGKCVALLPLNRDTDGNVQEPPETKLALLSAYEKAEKQASNPKDVGYWLTRFMLSDKFLRLGKLTQDDYRRYIEVVVDPRNPASKATHNGIRHVFGAMNPLAVRPTHIRRYMDYWNTPQKVKMENGTVLESAGKPTTANRHLSCLQAFFKWLRQYLTGLDTNPADGIQKFAEESRQVYITDEQYMTILQAALDSSTPWLFSYLEVAYLCGMRRSEVWSLNHDDIVTEDGQQYIRVVRKKGSKGELVGITERLHTAIDFAVSLYPAGVPEPMRNRPLIRNTRGDRITKSALQNAIENVRAATGIADIRTHDMKKKAGTDGKDLGHKTRRMTELYDLKLKKGKATR